jgi:hypothetical protein
MPIAHRETTDVAINTKGNQSLKSEVKRNMDEMINKILQERIQM